MRRVVLLTMLMLSTSMMMAADSCKVTVNVKTPAVSFALDSDGSKLAPSIDVKPGQSFTIGVPYQDGKAPYSCALANAPAWMAVNSDTPGFCTVTGTIPDCPESGTCDGSFTADLTVTDSNGAIATAKLGSPPSLAAIKPIP